VRGEEAFEEGIGTRLLNLRLRAFRFESSAKAGEVEAVEELGSGKVRREGEVKVKEVGEERE
jgi:hypothetical protein